MPVRIKENPVVQRRLPQRPSSCTLIGQLPSRWQSHHSLTADRRLLQAVSIDTSDVPLEEFSGPAPGISNAAGMTSMSFAEFVVQKKTPRPEFSPTIQHTRQ